ncbi:MULTISPECIES: IS66 family insertion sequence element accessory protein TnpA [unclassified Sphingobacterium]|uniref:IS66 family insertion sequence element accessory protein TnpA n=1 Tax=unclassified Sphingobacterium TaxID=2609468 RepID=UPI00391839AA
MSSKGKRDQILSMMADWQQSAMRKKQYCGSRGIKEAKFHYWFSRSREQNGATGRLKLVVVCRINTFTAINFQDFYKS